MTRLSQILLPFGLAFLLLSFSCTNMLNSNPVLSNITTSVVNNSSLFLKSRKADLECKNLVESFDWKKGLLISIDLAKGDINDLREKLSNTPWLPTTLESKIGERMFNSSSGFILKRNEHKKLYKILDQETSVLVQALNNSLNKKGYKLPYQFKFYIYDSNEKNAMSLPGGYILISKRVIKDIIKEQRENKRNKTYKKDAEYFLRFTMAHEISHNLKRHYAFILQNRILNGISDIKQLQELLIAISKLGKKPSDSYNIKENQNKIITQMIKYIAYGIENSKNLKEVSLNQYNDYEKEADACAVRILVSFYNNNQELKNTIMAFENELPLIQELDNKNPSKNDNRSIINDIKDINNALQYIVSFYLGEQKFWHPMTEERKMFLNNLLNKLKVQ